MKQLLALLCIVSTIKGGDNLKEAIKNGDVQSVRRYYGKKKGYMHIETHINQSGNAIESEKGSLLELAKLCLLDREKALQMAQTMDPYSQLAMGAGCVAVAIAHVACHYSSSRNDNPNKDTPSNSTTRFASVAQDALSPLALAGVGLKLFFLGAAGLYKKKERDDAADIVEIIEKN